MSWSLAIKEPVTKRFLPQAIDDAINDCLVSLRASNIEESMFIAMHDQMLVAKKAALAIADAVPGPLISVSMYGHTNAVGYQPKEGPANDMISITVSQATPSIRTCKGG